MVYFFFNLVKGKKKKKRNDLNYFICSETVYFRKPDRMKMNVVLKLSIKQEKKQVKARIRLIVRDQFPAESQTE